MKTKAEQIDKLDEDKKDTKVDDNKEETKNNKTRENKLEEKRRAIRNLTPATPRKFDFKKNNNTIKVKVRTPNKMSNYFYTKDSNMFVYTC